MQNGDRLLKKEISADGKTYQFGEFPTKKDPSYYVQIMKSQQKGERKVVYKELMFDNRTEALNYFNVVTNRKENSDSTEKSGSKNWIN